MTPLVTAGDALIPVIGLGTWELGGDVCRDAVGHALSLGYRHIDTAQIYGNEAYVGAAMRESGLDREDIFVTTKVWRDNLAPRQLRDCALRSADLLGPAPIDLLLVHWPNPDIQLAHTIEALCRLVDSGLVKHIGVSNFPIALLLEAIALAASHGIRIATNQCELHPWLSQKSLLQKCEANGVAFTAYSPLAKSECLRHPLLLRLADEHRRSPAQIVLRWHVQQPNVIAVPRSCSRLHVAENLSVFDFELRDDEMEAISLLARPDGRITAPSFSPIWDD